MHPNEDPMKTVSRSPLWLSTGLRCRAPLSQSGASCLEGTWSTRCLDDSEDGGLRLFFHAASGRLQRWHVHRHSARLNNGTWCWSWSWCWGWDWSRADRLWWWLCWNQHQHGHGRWWGTVVTLRARVTEHIGNTVTCLTLSNTKKG